MARTKNDLGHESATDDADDLDSQEQETVLPKRGFAEVAGSWVSFMETQGKADTLVLMLHRTGLSAETEFGSGLLPKLLGKPAPPGGFRVLAPDRPCHGYSPCFSGGAGEPSDATDWLKGLLVARKAPKQLRVVAVGREASVQALRLAKARRVKAKLLLVSSSLQEPRRGAAPPAKAEDLATWLQEWGARAGGAAGPLRTAAAAVDVGSWAVRRGTGPIATSDESTDSNLLREAAQLPAGCDVVLLHDAEGGEEEDHELKTVLEDSGVSVTVLAAGAEDNAHMADAIVDEVGRLAGVRSEHKDEEHEDN